METAVGQEQRTEAGITPARTGWQAENPEDQLRAPRGIAFGVMISAGIWATLGYLLL